MKKNILLYALLSESAITTWFGVGINTNIFVNKNDQQNKIISIIFILYIITIPSFVLLVGQKDDSFFNQYRNIKCLIYDCNWFG